MAAAPVAGRRPARPGGEVAAGDQGVGVVGSEDSQPVGQQFGVLAVWRRLSGRRPSPRHPARLLRGRSGVGVVGSEDGVSRSVSRYWKRRWAAPGPDRQPAPRPVGEVVAGGQGVEVVGSEDAQLVGEQVLEKAVAAPGGVAGLAPPSPGRGCCGWSGCRGGRVRGCAVGRSAGCW